MEFCFLVVNYSDADISDIKSNNGEQTNDKSSDCEVSDYNLLSNSVIS